MSGWNDEAQWVSDEDGLRWYFSERDPGGPSRLECYRRLLGESDGWDHRGNLASLSQAMMQLSGVWWTCSTSSNRTGAAGPSSRHETGH